MDKRQAESGTMRWLLLSLHAYHLEILYEVTKNIK